MMPTRVLRSAVLVLLALGLAGCGFHLRNALKLPPDVPAVKVVSTTPYSELVMALERSLQSAGAKLAGDDDAGAARLDVVSERWGDLPIAIDDQGRAQEFSLRYAAIFAFRLADGTDLVPQQAVELSRDYVSPPEDATGTSTEREILADELRREMAASILRRIDGVARARAATTAAGAGPAEAAASPEPEPEPEPTP